MKASNITLAALALLLAACGNEEIIESPENGTAAKVPMTFTAGTPQTRTSLAEGNAVYWTAGDRVAIYDGTTTLCEFEATEVNGSTATLKGEAAEATTYTAFYPFEAVTALTHGAVTFDLTATQTAVAGGFDGGLNPSWAQATDGSTELKFQNLCALAKFTVGTDGVTEVVLTANEKDDALAGSLTYSLADGTLKAAEEGASRSVTLTGTFESGQTYYFVVAPGTLAGGITLRYTGGDGKTYVKTTQKEVIFTAGEIADLGNVATDGFSEALNPAFAAAIMEKCSNVHLTENPDGTASVTENMRQMITVSTLYLDNCSLTSLAGIEYFINLQYLYCFDNSLKSLDVSKLTILRELYCYDNGLETLSLPTTSALTNLKCHNNALTALDVSKLTGLTYLTCYNNQMTALDITQNTELVELRCGQQKEELTLTLLETQRSLWNEFSYPICDENEGVTPYYQSTGSSATNVSFAGGSNVGL